MKKFLLFLLIFISFGVFLQSSAMAITLSIGDGYYVGRINDGIPSNLSDGVDYLNDLITLSPGATPTTVGSSTETYDRLESNLNIAFPEVLLAGAYKEDDDTNPDFDNIIDATGFTYIIGKYDANKAGAYVWYISGISDLSEVIIPSTAGATQNHPNGYGLSHISLFNPSPVPEPATMLLLGSGLVGLAGFRRKFQK